MKRKKTSRTSKKAKRSLLQSAEQSFELVSELIKLKKQVHEIGSHQGDADDRLQDIEIHINLITRLLTTLCVEKFGMRIGVLKRMIKRIEKETIRDSQILHLEEIYKLPPKSEKKSPPPSPHSKNDPWEEIS
jgi:hypothetical protein